jgi:hypothetical protein
LQREKVTKSVSLTFLSYCTIPTRKIDSAMNRHSTRFAWIVLRSQCRFLQSSTIKLSQMRSSKTRHLLSKATMTMSLNEAASAVLSNSVNQLAHTYVDLQNKDEVLDTHLYNTNVTKAKMRHTRLTTHPKYVIRDSVNS